MLDLQVAKQRLEAQREDLRQRLSAVEANVRHENEPQSSDWSEQATQRGNEEVVDALGNHAHAELKEVMHALERIESGDYPYCEACGQEILEKRLEILPYTEYCTPCAEKLEGQG